MPNYLLNTLSGIISSQLLLADTLSTNYYNSQEIDQKISGIPQLTDLVRMTSGEINTYYTQAQQLYNSFDF